jgi:hypothetical protein
MCHAFGCSWEIDRLDQQIDLFFIWGDAYSLDWGLVESSLQVQRNTTKKYVHSLTVTKAVLEDQRLSF